jgi:phenylalanine ammonia-lyase
MAELCTVSSNVSLSFAHAYLLLGVNTGVGGSSNTRTQHVEQLQASLVSMLHCGVIYPAAGKQSIVNDASRYPLDVVYQLQDGLQLEDSVSTNCMPESWVRSAILIRINSLMPGLSSVRPIIVERLIDLLRKDIIPRVPVHGSISASGDLCPLSYVAGAIQGKRQIAVLSGKDRHLTTADVAFAEADLSPVSLAAKEGLALVNGTAFSSGVGALVMHDVFGLCALAQILTAMSVEALGGAAESFHPIFAASRPHLGQVRVEVHNSIVHY